MEMKRYQLRLRGLEEADGEIKAKDLQHVLKALNTAAERATRLLATGHGSKKGPRPKWLDASVDFTVKGMQSGSTVLELEAPALGETARKELAQLNFLRPEVDHGNTALDQLSLAIMEVHEEEPAGYWTDDAVLGALLDFKKAIRFSNVSYELTAEGLATAEPVVLNEAVYEQIADRRKQTPSPKAFIVSGQLNEIKHRSRHFRLLLSNGSQLLGHLDTKKLDVEVLRSLWGKQSTVKGMVHFRANGKPHFIEAHRITTKSKGDVIFEAMPSTTRADAPGLFPLSEKKSPKSFDPMVLWGTWPGDESIEDLLAQLD